MTIPGTWQHVLIVACLLFVVALPLLARLQRAWRRRGSRTARRYARYRPRPDERDSLALFHRLMRARRFSA